MEESLKGIWELQAAGPSVGALELVVEEGST